MVGSPAPQRPRGTHSGRVTVGVEEEFLLVDPRNRQPAVRADAVWRLERTRRSGEIHRELTPVQIEAASSVCHDLTDLREDLARLRRDLATDAVHRGCRLAAVGAAPTGGAGPPPVTDTPRYRRMYADYGAIIEELGVCACQVHVGTTDLESALQASNHLRPWLPALLVLTANSPFYRSRDTGYASWRTALWSRLPTAGPPPYFISVEHYQALVDCLLRSGMVMDLGMIYWHARPSRHVPTLEVRVADAAATVDEAVLLAGLVRALVLRSQGCPAAPVDDHMLRAACWSAARGGLEGTALDVFTGRFVPSWQLLDDLVRHVRGVLEESGDSELISSLLATLQARGSAARRQREAFQRHQDIAEVIDHVVTETLRDA